MEPRPPDERPHLDRAKTAVPVRCRCGTRVPADGEVVVMAPLVPSVEAVLGTTVFCSENCVRAFILEALETLDAFDTPESGRVVRDIHETYRELAATFVSLMDA